jgi:DNA-directed RNA polymerase specialized sigma24 family protein
MPEQPGNPPADATVDWRSARERLRTYLTRSLPAADRQHLEDLVQEGLVRLLAAVRREQPRNFEALLNTITQRTRIDFIRRRARWRAVFAVLQEGDDAAARGRDGEAHELGDLLERLEFVVHGLLARDAAEECRALAEAYLKRQRWERVAAERALKADALRKRWSRCLEWIRRELAGDPLFAPLMRNPPKV